MAPLQIIPVTSNCESASSPWRPRFFRVVVATFAFVCASLALALVGSFATATPASAVITGIDVASHQHPNGVAINWQQVVSAGHRFAYVKATEGPGTGTDKCQRRTYYTNPYFAADWSGAGAAGLYRGAYHYARPQLPLSSAEEQARYFVSVAGPSNGAYDLPLELDLEETCGLGQSDLAEWTRRFLAEVTRITGKKPLVYTGRWFWQANIGAYGNDIGQNYRLWTADYRCQRHSLQKASSALLAALEKSAAANNSPFVVSISGVIAETPMAGLSSYSASKTAMHGYATAATRELRRAGIRWIDARPGHTESGLATRAIFGQAPAFGAGLKTEDVVARIVSAIKEDEKDLPSSSFVASVA